MPARKNKPGKSGTTSIAELFARAEEEALDSAKRRDLEHPGAVYWASTASLIDACDRLVARGDMITTHAYGAYRLAHRLRVR